MQAPSSIEVVAASLRRIRKKRGLSQEELGLKADLHRTYIGALERAEENMTLRTLDKLAKALSVQPADFFRKR